MFCTVSLSLHILLSLLCSADELKELPFFHPINWLDAMNQRLKPPLVPPRGEVNAADTFDIGSFSDDDVKGVKVCWWGEGVPECVGGVVMCWLLESKGGWMESRNVKLISKNSLLWFLSYVLAGASLTAPPPPPLPPSCMRRIKKSTRGSTLSCPPCGRQK